MILYSITTQLKYNLSPLGIFMPVKSGPNKKEIVESISTNPTWKNSTTGRHTLYGKTMVFWTLVKWLKILSLLALCIFTRTVYIHQETLNGLFCAC